MKTKKLERVIEINISFAFNLCPFRFRIFIYNKVIIPPILMQIPPEIIPEYR
jgi:hypothetical protein